MPKSGNDLVNYSVIKPPKFAEVYDTESGVGYVATGGVWTDFILDTIEAGDTGISLSSNRITLPGGYRWTLFGTCAMASCNRSHIRFYDHTNNTQLSIGNSFYSNGNRYVSFITEWTGEVSSDIDVALQYNTDASGAISVQGGDPTQTPQAATRVFIHRWG